MAEQDDPLVPLRQIGSIEVYKGWLQVDTLLFPLPSGELWKYDKVTLNPSGRGVAILPFDADKNVILCRQYRPAVDEVLLELIQGGVDDDEDLAKAAARELKEESGYEGTLKLMLQDAIPLAGSVNHRMSVYYATNCKQVCAPQHAETERLEIVKMPWYKLIGEVIGKKHKDALLCLAVMQYALNKGK
jgi:ADP-ribose pyrophosphatase